MAHLIGPSYHPLFPLAVLDYVRLGWTASSDSCSQHCLPYLTLDKVPFRLTEISSLESITSTDSIGFLTIRREARKKGFEAVLRFKEQTFNTRRRKYKASRFQEKTVYEYQVK